MSNPLPTVCNDPTTWNTTDLTKFSAGAPGDLGKCIQTNIKKNYKNCGELLAGIANFPSVYTALATQCVKDPNYGSSGSSSTWIIILVVFLALALVGAAVFFATRR
jgi:hypothetical protein